MNLCLKQKLRQQITTESNPETKSTTAKVETGVIMIPSNLDLKFQANAQKVNFNELTLKNAKGCMNMKKGVLTMQNTGFNLIGCDVNMNAKYQASTTKKALFEYDIKANDFDIKRAYNEIKIFREMASAAEKAKEQFHWITNSRAD